MQACVHARTYTQTHKTHGTDVLTGVALSLKSMTTPAACKSPSTHILKSQHTVTFYSKYSRALTFENVEVSHPVTGERDWLPNHCRDLVFLFVRLVGSETARACARPRERASREREPEERARRARSRSERESKRERKKEKERERKRKTARERKRESARARVRGSERERERERERDRSLRRQT